MPDLKPKLWPLSLFIPNAGLDGHDASCGGSLFIVETVIKPEEGWSGQYSDQFEVFVYHKPTLTSSCQPLPPPPFVRDPKFHNIRTKISSYAVVSGGSEACISVEGAGTYSFDTVKHTWRNLGQWTLPFNGKVEYVPELKLWIGLSAKTQQLAAADLSALDSQPELVKTWNELSPGEGWREIQDSQLVNLGAGRFCIARFFGIRSPKSYLYYDQIIEDYFAVLTGVEVVPCVDGNGSSCGNDKSSGGSSGQIKLQMVKHKSKLHLCNDGSLIKAVF
ncbi:hypothetical protein BS78_07G002900 [Paspalum vaginatum]|nr:hypothetical protein BS78_07G002900 [Paspalum vaginatum]